MTRTAARSVFTVDFGSEPPRRSTVAPEGRVLRVARLLALAHRIDRMIRTGELRDLADAARACNLTRARMTQIANLLLLAPAIQETIIELPPVTKGRDSITERTLRPIVAEPDWQRQLEMWNQIGAQDERTPVLSDQDGKAILRGDPAEPSATASPAERTSRTAG